MTFLPNLAPHLEEIKAKNEAELKKKELIALMQPVPPFSEKEMTPEAIKLRLENSAKDFWFWDKTYFPKEAYPEDYAKPGKFHQELVDLAEKKDKIAHVVIGPRDTAKTATLKKKFIYDFLHGKRRNMAVGSETLAAPGFFILDIIYFLTTNERILCDYKIDWIEKSSEKLFARSEQNPKGTFVDALSMERSSRGRSRGVLLRYDYIFLTDWENNTSSLTKDAREDRITTINEMRTSLSSDGTLIAEGNNFDPDTSQNLLLTEKDKGILSEYFQVHHYPAWDNNRKGKYKCIWFNRYPANSERDLKAMMKPKDQYDWDGNFQGRPRKKSGDQFPDTNYQEWEIFPDDIKAVVYADPNCSLKGKGDTTAITALGWSCKQQAYYIINARCKSYFDSNELLMDYLKLKSEVEKVATVVSCAMDGNVTQESTWTNNILQFTRINDFPYPYIVFVHYNVDDLVTSPSGEWKQNKFYFPPGFRKTDEGLEYTKQVFAFKTKKERKKDDAPDTMICSYQLLIQFGISMLASSSAEIHNVCNRNILKKNRP